MAPEVWGGARGYPTYRCVECTLVRCFASNIRCDECLSRVVKANNEARQQQIVDAGTAAYAPCDWTSWMGGS